MAASGNSSKVEASLINTLKKFTGALKGMYGNINNISNTWAKVDQASANFARSVGLAAEGMKDLRNSALALVRTSKLAINYGVSAEKLIQLQNQYVQGIGRNVMQSTSGLTNFAAMTRLLQDQGAIEMSAKLENFGLSMEEVGDRVGKMFAEASKKGLSFETYSKNFLTNIEIAQNYNFAEGLKGLENMARKASQIKLDMQQTASFANKVNTVEGAVSVGAKLQVLGGTFSQFADPMGMLNESLNDMEALQDRLIKMMGNLGQFNRETGEIEISAFNKRRIAAASEAMGVSSSEMMKMINSNARRNEIENQLTERTDLSRDMRELIANIGVFRNGVAGVNIDGEFKRLTQISNEDQKTLIRQTQSQSDDIKEIARTLRGWDETRRGRIEQYKNAEANTVGRVFGNITKGIDKVLGVLGPILGIAASLSGVGSIAGGALSLLRVFKKEKGGLLEGPSHAQGGMPIMGSNIEVEGGEFVVNKNATKKNLPLLNAINKDKYEDGGIIGGDKGSNFNYGNIMTYLMFMEMMKNKKPSTFTDKRALVAKRQTANVKWDNLMKHSKGVGMVGKVPKINAIGGAALGAIGAATSIMSMVNTKKKLSSGEIERGSKEHKKANRESAMSIGASIGGSVGALIPVPILGPIIGSAVGSAIGIGLSALYNKRQKENMDIKKAIGLAGLHLKGDYKRNELNEIKKALSGDRKITYGEFLNFNKNLQEKLITYNDYNLPLNKTYIKKEKGGLLEGPSHDRGGMPIKGSNIEVEGGEFVVNKNATEKNLGLLNKINNGDIIKRKNKASENQIIVLPLMNNMDSISKPTEISKPKLGEVKKPTTIQTYYNNITNPKTVEVIKPRVDDLQKPLKVTPTQQTIQAQQKPVEIKPISLDISGTIKLDIPSTAQNIDITKELLKNPNFINSLTQLIEKQMIINEKGGYIPNKGLK